MTESQANSKVARAIDKHDLGGIDETEVELDLEV